MSRTEEVLDFSEAKTEQMKTNMPEGSGDMLEGELDGEINKLASSTFGKFSLKNMSFKQIYRSQWSNMRSWGSFMDTQKMNAPTGTRIWSRRLIRNLEYFQSNYLCVFLILVIYCVLTSPLLLLAIAAALGACYIITLKNAESPLKIMGYTLSIGQQYLIVALASFPLFFLAGAGAAVFWVLGASFFVIGLHASIYAIEAIDSEADQALFDSFAPLTSVRSI